MGHPPLRVPVRVSVVRLKALESETSDPRRFAQGGGTAILFEISWTP